LYLIERLYSVGETVKGKIKKIYPIAINKGAPARLREPPDLSANGEKGNPSAIGR
jgi:hypothetical protein